MVDDDIPPLSSRVLREKCEMLPKFWQIKKKQLTCTYQTTIKNDFLNGIGPHL